MKKKLFVIHFDIDENLKKYFKGNFFSYSVTSLTINRVKDKERVETISIKSQSKIDKTVLNNLPKLKCILTRTVGTDHIDLNQCKKRDIAVYHIPDYGSYNIADHAFGLLLAGARQIIKANSFVHQGKFYYQPFLGTALKGKVLGVVGTGKIGLEMIKRAKSFGLKIIAYDVFKNDQASKELEFTYQPLNNLLKKSDIISFHVPLLDSTYHLISKKEINLMKQGAILINTARGEIINTKSLIENIKKFKAVCLDVLEDEESFSRKNPLLKFDNVIITPHIGFYTDDSIKKIVRETEMNIKRFLKKSRVNRVV